MPLTGARDLDAGGQLDALTAAADRRPGSVANDVAVDFAAEVLRSLGWRVETPGFEVIAWQAGAGHLAAAHGRVDVVPSPYGIGVTARGTLLDAGTVTEVELLARTGDAAGQVLLLHGDITREPLTPQAFPFYSVDGHDHLRGLLVAASPAAIVSITGVMPELCGAVEPFPFIEDGDFPIPVADVSPSEGSRLLDWVGGEVVIDLDARRWPAGARNVVARRGPDGPRTVVMAHIDSKPGTPGALDNAAGVVVLLQLAGLLGDDRPVELVAFNGEDYFSAAGEVHYLSGLEARGDSLDDVRLAVNIDAAGHVGDDACWSAYNIEGRDLEHMGRVMSRPRLLPGPQWWQSDHAIFAMRGRPAVAFTSDRLEELMAEVVHTAADVPTVVDTATLVTVAEAIADLVRLEPAAG